MKFYQLERKITLPITIDEAWDFFSSPHNLDKITPPQMNMRVQSMTGGDKMFAGQIITYTITPLLGIPMDWMTEITHVVDKQYFVDEQRFGPYAMWHHTHFFKPINGGVEMTDVVNYVMPFGILGRLAHWLFIGKQIEGIFEYRNEVMMKKWLSP